MTQDDARRCASREEEKSRELKTNGAEDPVTRRGGTVPRRVSMACDGVFRRSVTYRESRDTRPACSAGAPPPPRARPSNIPSASPRRLDGEELDVTLDGRAVAQQQRDLTVMGRRMSSRSESRVVREVTPPPSIKYAVIPVIPNT